MAMRLSFLSVVTLFLSGMSFGESLTVLRTTELKTYSLKPAFCSLDAKRFYLSAWQGSMKGRTLTGEFMLTIPGLKSKLLENLDKGIELRDQSAGAITAIFTDKSAVSWRLDPKNPEKSYCSLNITQTDAKLLQIEAHCVGLVREDGEVGSLDIEADKASPLLCEKLVDIL